MKKTITLIIVLALCISVFAACGKDDSPGLRNLDLGQDRVPANDAPRQSNDSPTGFYTIASIIEDGEDVLEFYDSHGINTDDIFIEFMSGGNVRMGFMPDDEDEIAQGTFRVSADSVTIRIDGEEVTGTIEGNSIHLNIDGTEMVFERNSRYRGPTFPERDDREPTEPEAPAGPASATIPGSGGSVRISGETEVTFTPDQSGMWEL